MLICSVIIMLSGLKYCTMWNLVTLNYLEYCSLSQDYPGSAYFKFVVGSFDYHNNSTVKKKQPHKTH